MSRCDHGFRDGTGCPVCDPPDIGAIQDQIDALAARVTALESPPLDTDKVAEALVRALYLYGGYTVNTRHVSGCIIDALEIVAPEIASELRENAAAAVYQKHWGDQDK